MKSTEKQYELYSTIEYIKSSKEYNEADRDVLPKKDSVQRYMKQI